MKNTIKNILLLGILLIGMVTLDIFLIIRSEDTNICKSYKNISIEIMIARQARVSKKVMMIDNKYGNIASYAYIVDEAYKVSIGDNGDDKLNAIVGFGESIFDTCINSN